MYRRINHNELTEQILKLINLTLEKNKNEYARYIRVGNKNIDLYAQLLKLKETVNKLDFLNNTNNLEEKIDNIERNLEDIRNGNTDIQLPTDLIQQVNKNTQDIIYILQLIQFGITGSGHGNQLDNMRLDNAVLV